MYKKVKLTLFLCLSILTTWNAVAQSECDCQLNETEEWICVTTENGEIPFPNACFAECAGYGSEAIVTCPDWGPGDWENPFENCDCQLNETEEWICVTTENGEIPFPNACFAECAGYGPETIVTCSDWEPGDWENPFENCDCQLNETEEWICVTTENGEIPFPNACFAECAGYGPETIVTCPNWESDDWENPFENCECTEEYNPVCMTIDNGEVVEFPNVCIAICLGFDEEELTDCDGFNNNDDNESSVDIEPFTFISLNELKKVSLTPNPNDGWMNLNFIADQDFEKIEIKILSPQGKVLQTQHINAYAGQNQATISATQLPMGIYLVQLSSGSFQKIMKFVKQ